MMPNMHVLTQDTPCVLLHRVLPGGELKEVATAIIVQPLTCDMHNTRMSEVVMKVTVTEVVPKFRDIDPPCNLREPRNTWSLENAPSG